MNKFICIGRWSKPVELRFTPNGKAVSSSTIAINEGYGDNKTTIFMPVVIWGKIGEVVAEHSKKGDQVAIEGRISNRSWEKDGQKKYVTEIIAEKVEFLAKKSENNQPSDPFKDSKTIDIDFDQLPF